MRLSFSLVCLSLVGCGVGLDEGRVDSETASVTSNLARPLIFFGQGEVRRGALKTASGEALRKGQSATLRLFLPELGGFLCGEYCFAVGPHLFVRFNGADDFHELAGLPRATYMARGPFTTWPDDGVAEVPLVLPTTADRVEVYMRFERMTWNGNTCYLAYDLTECPDSSPISDAYLSNYGRNFSIAVE